MEATHNHSHFEELAALSAGGLLSVEEMQEFRAHATTCAECQNCEAEFIQIVRLGLPLTSDTLPGRSVEIVSEPEEKFRERFLQRAIGEGFRFSQEVEPPWRALRERSS